MASDQTNPLWERARTILDEAERIEQGVLRARPAAPTWTPPVDVLDSRDEVVVLVAIPGVEARAVDLTLEGSRLTIAGIRRSPRASARASYHQLEIPRGRFERKLDLPSGIYAIRSRELVHGVLAIHLARR